MTDPDPRLYGPCCDIPSGGHGTECPNYEPPTPDPRDFPHPCTGCGAKRPFGPEGHTVDCPVADPMRNEPGFAARVYDSVARRQATPPTPDPRSATLTAADFGTDEPRMVPATCTHYCEGGHFDGDDMVMVDVGRLYWQERAVLLREDIDRLRREHDRARVHIRDVHRCQHVNDWNWPGLLNVDRLAIEAEARPAPTALVEALRHCATVIVSAGPALQRAVTASPNQTTLRLNRALQQHAEDAYREAKAALAAQPPAPPG